MIKFVAITVNQEQLEELLLCTHKIGIVPELGVVASPAPARPKTTEQVKKKGKVAKPKRYPPSMTVKIVGPPPADSAPRVAEAYKHLVEEFGAEPFEKRRARPFLDSKMGARAGGSTVMTALMDMGAITEWSGK